MTNSLIGDYCEKLQKVYAYMLNQNSLPRDGELCLLLLAHTQKIASKGLANHLFKASRTFEFIETVWRNLESGDEGVLTFSLQIFDVLLTYSSSTTSSSSSDQLTQQESLLKGFLEILKQNNLDRRKNWTARVTAAISNVLLGLCHHVVGWEWIVTQIDVIMDVVCAILSTSQNMLDISAASAFILQLLKAEGTTLSSLTMNNSVGTAQTPNKDEDQTSVPSLMTESSPSNTNDFHHKSISFVTRPVLDERGDTSEHDVGLKVDNHVSQAPVFCDSGWRKDNMSASITNHVNENGSSLSSSIIESSSFTNSIQRHAWNSFWRIFDVPLEEKMELDNGSTGRQRVKPQLIHVLCTMSSETVVRKHILADREKCQLLLDWTLDTGISSDLIAELWANILVEDSGELLSEVNTMVLQVFHAGQVQRALILASKLYSKSSSVIFKDILFLPVRWVFARDKLSSQGGSDVSVSEAVQASLSNKKGLTTAVLTCFNAALTIKSHLTRDGELLSYAVRLLDNRMITCSQSDWRNIQVLSANVKLQMSVVQLLKAASADIGEDNRMLSVLLDMVQNPESAAQILPHAFSAIRNLLSCHFHNTNVNDVGLDDEGIDCINMVSTSGSMSYASQLSLLAECVLKRLSSVQWEIRDTALEFIQSLIRKYSSLDSFWSWLECHHMLRHAWQCHDDAESYVRAAALQTATELVSVGRWNTFIQHIMAEQLSIIHEVLNLIQCNTEAFTRRAAIDLIISLYKQHILTDTNIMSEVFHVFADFVPNDFDWEVKIKGLMFWESVIADNTRDETETVLPQENGESIRLGFKRAGGDIADNLNSANNKKITTLLKIGCTKALRSAYTDYDDSVKKQSCVLLKTLQQDLQLDPMISSLSPKHAKTTKEECAANSSPEIISHVEVHHGKDITSECSDFIRFLQSTDFEAEENGSLISVDDEIAEAEHVLDDIVRCMTNDEVILDCY